MSIPTVVEHILSEMRFWQTRTEWPTKPGHGHTSATSLAIRVATSTAYGSHRMVKLSRFATLSSMRTRSLTQKRNPCVNTVCGSIEKTLVELNLFQTLTNCKIRRQTQKLGLPSLWVMEMAMEVMESMKSIQKTIRTARISLGTILHL